MTLQSVNIKTVFDLTESPEEFKFTDTTDYSSIDINDVVGGVLRIEVLESSFLVYNNTDFNNPDIDPSTSLQSLIEVLLPKDSSGNIIEGTYKVTYTVRVDDGVDPAYDVDVEKEFEYKYKSPVVKLEKTVDCITPLLKSNDVTNYVVNGKSPDEITRVHNINYPLSIDQPTVEGTTKEVSTSVFYTLPDNSLEHSSDLKSTLEYHYDGDFEIHDEVTGVCYIPVACSAQLCDIYCCLKAAWNRYMDNSSTHKAKEYFDHWVKMATTAHHIALALKCGKGADVDKYVNYLNLIGNCDDCKCSGDAPQLVTGLGLNGNLIQISAGTGIKVTTGESGNTTVYTIGLSDANVAKLSALHNTIVEAGDGITVTPETLDNGDKKYTVSLTDPSEGESQSSIITSNLLVARCKIAFSTSSIPTLTVESWKRYGSLFSSISNNFVKNVNDGSVSIFEGKNNHFRIENFLSENKKFFQSMQVVKVKKKSLVNVVGEWNIRSGVYNYASADTDIQLEIIDGDSPGQDFDFRFINMSGDRLTGSLLNDNYEEIEFVVKLTI